MEFSVFPSFLYHCTSGLVILRIYHSYIVLGHVDFHYVEINAFININYQQYRPRCLSHTLHAFVQLIKIGKKTK